ncbi:MAG: NAD(P)/FAD-dependent oxidoreductase [Tannerella sp.]|jgi:all-trans-retinol 13,14-reductase|nr:NAD(P)/FAD-dependent oxidoreductase [Tannerella sp.]
MESYDVIIIGSGLGGLECGYILARHGMKVCVLERHAQPGGCLQTFQRGSVRFDTGFHYVGGLGEGQPLHRLFRYFGLLDLPWHPLDEAAFDEVVIDGKTYAFANGYERFADTLAQHFPARRGELATYAAFLKHVGEHLFDAFRPGNADELYTTSLFARSAHDFLKETTDDPLLRNVLSGTSLKMELRADTLPLYVFAQINSAFIRSAWRLRGGGSQIAERLVQRLRAMGGEVRMRAEVTRLTEAGGRLATVEVNGEEQLSARWVISDVHPAFTLSLIDETKLLRNIYRKRIASLPNTFGMFTLHLRLKPGSVPYRNRNVFVHENRSDGWHDRPEDGPKGVMISYYPPETGSCTPALDILTPMCWSEVTPWKDLPPGRRGESYARLKAGRAEACLRLASRHIPGLRDAVEKMYTSTPLSYASYTGAVEGTAYGIRKDFTRPMYTVLTPRTPIPNLLLTGQNLNLHGILGVSITSFFTCAEILGRETVVKGLELNG